MKKRNVFGMLALAGLMVSGAGCKERVSQTPQRAPESPAIESPAIPLRGSMIKELGEKAAMAQSRVDEEAKLAVKRIPSEVQKLAALAADQDTECTDWRERRDFAAAYYDRYCAEWGIRRLSDSSQAAVSVVNLVESSGRINPGAKLYQKSGEMVGEVVTADSNMVIFRQPDGTLSQKTRDTVKKFFMVERE